MDQDDFYENFWDFFRKNKKEIIGALIGLLISILLLYIGVLRTVIIVIFTLAGFLIGSRDDLEEDFKNLIEKLLPL